MTTADESTEKRKRLLVRAQTRMLKKERMTICSSRQKDTDP